MTPGRPAQNHQEPWMEELYLVRRLKVSLAVVDTRPYQNFIHTKKFIIKILIAVLTPCLHKAPLGEEGQMPLIHSWGESTLGSPRSHGRGGRCVKKSLEHTTFVGGQA